MSLSAFRESLLLCMACHLPESWGLVFLNNKQDFNVESLGFALLIRSLEFF